MSFINFIILMLKYCIRSLFKIATRSILIFVLYTLDIVT